MNVGTIDRLIRIIIGIALIALAYTEVVGAWGYIGIIPLATGLLRWCPLYTLLGVQTCPLHETVKRD
ncbi:DUF2892 domain-containing protein [Thiomicrorhabdus sp. Kp2]|uniref:YgaP family membrane protein n=1 Tax=Thiomicrorhabdus sp. Kp2 TaxID=1123518 RepID=UPI000410CD0D|nr:DUF2892 domain-containing protein [Thiomicrorhabdus sp. Kp2]